MWSPAEKGLTSWLSFVMSNCEVVTFPLVSWVRCGACLYQFLIFASFLLWYYFHIGKKQSSRTEVHDNLESIICDMFYMYNEPSLIVSAYDQEMPQSHTTYQYCIKFNGMMHQNSKV